MAKRKEVNIFDNPYSGKVLIYIFEKERIMKSELLIFANNRAITDTLELLKSKNIISIVEEKNPYQTFWITLTDTGYNVAKKYQSIIDLENGLTPEPENNYSASKESVSVMRKT